MSTHFVYFISQGNAAKIGYTCDVDKRVAQLQTGSPYRLKQLAVFCFETEGAARECEAWWHKVCGGGRLQGEWFKLHVVKRRLRSAQRPTKSWLADAIRA